MSLAAALAADGMRPASFLPAIKCSGCGQEIEIASMGEHRCAGSEDPDSSPDSWNAQPSQHNTTSQNPYAMRPYNAGGYQSVHAPSPLHFSQQSDDPPPPPSAPSHSQSQSRSYNSFSSPAPMAAPSRPPLPRIDPSAANRPFTAVRSETPSSPAMSIRSMSSGGRPAFHRSKTPTTPRLYTPRPPSEELSANLDCAFPPFPLNNNQTKRKPSQGRKTPTTNERIPSRSTSRPGLAINPGLTVPADNNLVPKSPRETGGENVLERMNSMRSGPFDGMSQTSGSSTPLSTETLDRRKPSGSGFGWLQDNSLPPTPEAGTAVTTEPQSFFDQQPGGAPPRPARPTSSDVLSPAFLRQLADQPVELSTGLAPISPPVPLRSPARPTFGFPDEEPVEHGNFNALTKVQSDPTHDNRPLPRKESLSQTGTSVPARLRNDISHTPSQSSSSTASSAHSGLDSFGTNATSPVGSATSSVDIFSPIGFSPATFGQDDKARGLGIRPAEEPGMRAELPARRSPPRDFARPALPNIDVDTDPVEAPVAPFIEHHEESPLDPALPTFAKTGPSPYAPDIRPPVQRTVTEPLPQFQEPTLSQIDFDTPEVTSKDMGFMFDPPTPSPSIPEIIESPPPQEDEYLDVTPALPPPPPEPTEPPAAFPKRSTSLRRPGRDRAKSNAAPPSPPKVEPQLPVVPGMIGPPPRKDSHAFGGPVQPLARNPTSAGKSTCRGCRQRIEGKSVKAADGRLTGRWHKACFTCRTCRQPFSTADFYVIDNHPYCEHHYHEKNGSLCRGCNLGIEGQYLEASTMTRNGRVDRKFHPRCFTCTDCRVILKDDYFEYQGRIFCERHALAAMRSQARPGPMGPGPGGLAPMDNRGLKAERRTTRLMMMGPGGMS